ncbi:MAG: PQQ-like beta-propeller repeat protein [Cyclobacteriaceae bacterium]|nr:MAG: PQQ-like beta-propeller repeat protein [Cyclobacteriaceae bacterium]
MKNVILPILILLPYLVTSQATKWKEQITEYSPKLLSEVSGLAKVELLQFADEYEVNPAARKTKNETLILINDGVSYYQKTNYQNENIEISKNSNGIEQFIVLKNAVQSYPINSQGFILTNNFSHGSGSRIDFYSPDLRQLNTYKPFPAGYKDFNFGTLNNLVCLYTREDFASKSFKLSLLDQSGVVKQEKEFLSEEHSVFNIKITKTNILVFMHVYNSSINDYSSRILSFDFYLNEIWRKNINGRIQFDPLTKVDSKQIVFSVGNNIFCLNELNGSNMWTASLLSNQGKSNKVIEILKSKFVNSDKYIVSVLGYYSKSNGQFQENVLYVLNPTNGTITYQKKIGSSLSELKVLPTNTGFIILKDSQLFSYTSEK